MHLHSYTRNKMDILDMSQECYSYMKIKQFLADRLCQQQIEIDTLRSKLKYYIGKDTENAYLISKMATQLKYLKKKDKSFSLCSEEAISQEIDNGEDAKKNQTETMLVNEDLIEEINKLTTDKYILFNELNELIMALKKCNLQKLNSLLIKDKEFNQEEIPVICGMQLNVLSADSQLSQIIRVDQSRNLKAINKENLDYYDKLVTEAEKDFYNLIETKFQRFHIS